MPDRSGTHLGKRPRALRLGYAAFAIVALALLFAAEVWPGERDYAPNLFGEIIGIFLTVLVVERLLRWERQRELAPLRAVALRRVKRPIVRLVTLVARMYKAAAEPGTKAPASLEELLDGWVREARWLDFKTEAPVLPRRAWLAWTSTEVEQVEQLLLGDLDRYAEPLGERFVVAAEDLLEHWVVHLLKQLPTIPVVDAEQGISRPHLLVLSGDNGGLREFADLLLGLVAAYDEIAPQPLAAIGDWKEDSAPHWGASRFEPPAVHEAP
jgi:hypothetical protein